MGNKQRPRLITGAFLCLALGPPKKFVDIGAKGPEPILLVRAFFMPILAERVGFEPTIRLPLYRFSRPALSSAQPSLRGQYYS